MLAGLVASNSVHTLRFVEKTEVRGSKGSLCWLNCIDVMPFSRLQPLYSELGSPPGSENSIL